MCVKYHFTHTCKIWAWSYLPCLVHFSLLIIPVSIGSYLQTSKFNDALIHQTARFPHTWPSKLFIVKLSPNVITSTANCFFSPWSVLQRFRLRYWIYIEPEFAMISFTSLAYTPFSCITRPQQQQIQTLIIRPRTRSQTNYSSLDIGSPWHTSGGRAFVFRPRARHQSIVCGRGSRSAKNAACRAAPSRVLHHRRAGHRWHAACWERPIFECSVRLVSIFYSTRFYTFIIELILYRKSMAIDLYICC